MAGPQRQPRPHGPVRHSSAQQGTAKNRTERPGPARPPRSGPSTRPRLEAQRRPARPLADPSRTPARPGPNPQRPATPTATATPTRTEPNGRSRLSASPRSPHAALRLTAARRRPDAGPQPEAAPARPHACALLPSGARTASRCARRPPGRSEAARRPLAAGGSSPRLGQLGQLGAVRGRPCGDGEPRAPRRPCAGRAIAANGRPRSVRCSRERLAPR